jgi:hypothetical protein
MDLADGADALIERRIGVRLRATGLTSVMP